MEPAVAVRGRTSAYSDFNKPAARIITKHMCERIKHHRLQRIGILHNNSRIQPASGGILQQQAVGAAC